MASQENVLRSFLDQHPSMEQGLAAYRVEMDETEVQDKTPIDRQIAVICDRPLAKVDDVEVVLDHLARHAQHHLTPRDKRLLEQAGLDPGSERAGLVMRMFEQTLGQAALIHRSEHPTSYDAWACALRDRYDGACAATLLNIEFLVGLTQGKCWGSPNIVQDLLAWSWPLAAQQYTPPEKTDFMGPQERRKQESPLVCLAIAWRLSKIEPTSTPQAMERLRIHLDALGPIQHHKEFAQVVADMATHIRRASLENHVQEIPARSGWARKL